MGIEVIELPRMPDYQVYTRLIAETLPMCGYQNVHADIPGYRLPELIKGAQRDHRPALVATTRGHLVFFDVTIPESKHLSREQVSRWQLFSSAAELMEGEFHVVIPRWLKTNTAGGKFARTWADLIGADVDYYWEI